ncbi:MAG: hypothetical protein ACTIID_12925 [Brevibacterium linens]|uniref:hypothetical protein n=1 Tax=Brevibacterium linens TaxID=1703 RepID=UPI003F9BDFCD
MPVDPRNITTEQIGTRTRDAAADPDAPENNFHHGSRLRDGATDPRPGDYLGPSNAGVEGEAGNPHGPNVVNPELRERDTPDPAPEV